MEPDHKLETLRKLLEAAYEDHPTKQDVVDTFKALSGAIKDLHGRITDALTEKSGELADADDAQQKQIDDAHGRIDDANEQIASAHDRIDKVQLTPGPKGDKGDSIKGDKGDDGDDGSPDSAEDIRNKLEGLEDDERLDASAIKGLDELSRKVDEKTGTQVRIGWGAHPLTIRGLGIDIDKNTRFIDFTGAGIGSVSRSTDGVVTVNITGGGGSSGTLVTEEVPTDSGDHINFTIAHTPLAGTFKLYRGGARQASVGTSPDYTLTGTALVLGTALDTVDGEKLFADYAY